MKKANKLSEEQLKKVSGGGSTNEENSNGFRKYCPVCDTFSWCVKTGNYREGIILDDVEYLCSSCKGTFWD